LKSLSICGCALRQLLKLRVPSLDTMEYGYHTTANQYISMDLSYVLVCCCMAPIVVGFSGFFCNNRQDRTITSNSVQQVGLFCTYQVIADGNVLFTNNHIASELHINLSMLLQNARAKTPDTTARHCTARPDKCRITK